MPNGLAELIQCNGIGDCLQAIYNLGVQVAVTLAFLMLIIGGVEYMLSGTMPGKLRGKKRITDSILGLLVLFLSGSVLYWINPNIFKATLMLPQIYFEFKLVAEEECLDCIPLKYVIEQRGWEYITVKSEANVMISTGIIEYLNKVNDTLAKLKASNEEKGVTTTLKARVTAGYDQNGHMSKCHTKYGTCIDVVPEYEEASDPPDDNKDCANWVILGSVLTATRPIKILYEYTTEGTNFGFRDDTYCRTNQFENNICSGRAWECVKNVNATGRHFHVQVIPNPQ